MKLDTDKCAVCSESSPTHFCPSLVTRFVPSSPPSHATLSTNDGPTINPATATLCRSSVTTAGRLLRLDLHILLNMDVFVGLQGI